MTGLDAAISEFGMDEAFDIEQLEPLLKDLLRDRERIYYDLGRYPRFDRKLIGWLNELRPTQEAVASTVPPASRRLRFGSRYTHWTTCCTICACTRVARNWP